MDRLTSADSRRDFLATGAGIAAAGVLAASANAAGRSMTEQEKLSRIATNTWPLRSLFKTRSQRMSPRNAEMKKKYGEITLLDFPQFTRDQFPGVTHMDIFSGLFGDVADDSMFSQQTLTFNGNTRTTYEFDPSLPSAKKWLEKLAGKIDTTGVRCQHISNNAPRDLSDPDPEKRKAGIAVGKKWLDGAAMLGTRSMRVNTGGPRILPEAKAGPDGYPKNDEITKYLANAIESFKELADHGGKAGVRITIENHWGLSANPAHIVIILNEVNHPYCEATPDFCNWEHEYTLYNGLKMLVPYTHSNVHAKYWNRWQEVDLARCVRILIEGGFKGTFALEYEDGPWDGMEGVRYLYKEVMAAL
jgi:sugar phosphate isomerase/epimerase